MANNEELTGTLANDKEYQKWRDELQNSGLSDKEISLKIREKLLESPDMDKKSKEIFISTYDYISKLIDQGKPFEINLLRIYLQDINGYDLSEFSIIGTLILCAFCGLSIKITNCL